MTHSLRASLARRGVLPLLLLLLALAAAATTPRTALRDYMNNGDRSFRWSVTDSLRSGDVTAYRLRLVSQTWRGMPWVHELMVMVPDRVDHSEALLHIAGGSCDAATGEPELHEWDSSVTRYLRRVARDCRAVTAVLWQVPRQPLFGGMKEDELLSHTLARYLATGDCSWPLLFPMAKSAARAMDAIGQLTDGPRAGRRATRFVVNGLSKRGWTTWLAAATGDKRVRAIAPMVIDILNMPVNVPYQMHMYGGSCSDMIRDYAALGLTDMAASGQGRDVVEMIDPYSYRGRYKMPKLLGLGANDEYWTVDAVKNYVDGLPAPVSIVYTPNAGHGLGDKSTAFNSLEAFFHQTIHGRRYPAPVCAASLSGDTARLEVTRGRDGMVEAVLWEARSDTRDFRRARFEQVCAAQPRGRRLTLSTPLPASGYKAFFAQYTYRMPVGEGTYTLCSRMYTADSSELFDKPFRP